MFQAAVACEIFRVNEIEYTHTHTLTQIWMLGIDMIYDTCQCMYASFVEFKLVTYTTISKQQQNIDV